MAALAARMQMAVQVDQKLRVEPVDQRQRFVQADQMARVSRIVQMVKPDWFE